VEEWIGGGGGGGGGRGAERVVPLPGERGAEEGERLAGACGRFEERVGASLPPRTVERGDDPPHERQLRPVGLVGELHRNAAHLVHASASSFRPRARGWRRRGEVVVIGHGGAAHRRVAETDLGGGGLGLWAGGIGGKCEAEVTRNVVARHLISCREMGLCSWANVPSSFGPIGFSPLAN